MSPHARVIVSVEDTKGKDRVHCQQQTTMLELDRRRDSVGSVLALMLEHCILGVAKKLTEPEPIPDAIYILYSGESADGRGPGQFLKRTSDRAEAERHAEECDKNPYSVGSVTVLTKDGLSRMF